MDPDGGYESRSDVEGGSMDRDVIAGIVSFFNSAEGSSGVGCVPIPAIRPWIDRIVAPQVLQAIVAFWVLQLGAH